GSKVYCRESTPKPRMPRSTTCYPNSCACSRNSMEGSMRLRKSMTIQTTEAKSPIRNTSNPEYVKSFYCFTPAQTSVKLQQATPSKSACSMLTTIFDSILPPGIAQLRAGSRRDVIRKLRQRFCLCLAVVGFAFASVRAAANYPNRSITVVLPYSAGGVTDTIARVVFD